MKDWERWMEIASPNIFRYEDLLDHYDAQVN